MSRYRKFDLGFWSDEKIRALSRPPPNGRDLAAYLLTAKESIVIPGLIPTVLGMAETLRWDPVGFLKAMEEVIATGIALVDFDAPLLWLPNAVKYNPPESPNVLRHWAKAWPEVPECELKLKAFHGLQEFVGGLGQGFREAFREAFREPSRKALAKPLASPPERVIEVRSVSIGSPFPESVTGAVAVTGSEDRAGAGAPEPPPSAPPREPKNRKLSRQQAAFTWCKGERAKHTDKSDEDPKPTALNAQLAPILDELGVPRFKRCYLHFLESKTGAKLTPPFAWRFFVSQYRRFDVPEGATGKFEPTESDVDPYRAGGRGG